MCTQVIKGLICNYLGTAEGVHLKLSGPKALSKDISSMLQLQF